MWMAYENSGRGWLRQNDLGRNFDVPVGTKPFLDPTNATGSHLVSSNPADQLPYGLSNQPKTWHGIITSRYGGLVDLARYPKGAGGHAGHNGIFQRLLGLRKTVGLALGNSREIR